jgi:dienelactone hydrolase
MPIATRPLRYRDGPVELTGYVAVDEQPGNPRPGLLLVHGGGGLDENARHQARRYAALGYPVLACDMFGEIPADREQVMTRIRAMDEDPDAMVSRAMAGVRELRGLSEVDGRVAAVGFCFGGTTVLTLARAGADLAGVISMHGGLSTSRPAQRVRCTRRSSSATAQTIRMYQLTTWCAS